MIPLEKEAEVHKMLVAGTSHSVISATMGVSTSTIARISRAIRIASKIGRRKRGRVRMLLIAGISTGGIACRLKISPDAVWAIKRAEFLMASVVEAPHQCPTCGGTMLPEAEGEEHEPTDTPGQISGENAAKLHRLADDVIGLSKALTIQNMLFYEIADRAERLIATIAGEEKDAEAE